MERLTKRLDDGQAVMRCEDCKASWMRKHGKPMEECTAMYCRNMCKDRLAAYEDTGLTPEEVERSKLEIEAGCVKAIARTYGIGINRLRKLAEADKDGRVVVLPNKPSSTITNADRIRNATNQQLAKQIYDSQKELCRMLYKNLGFEDELNFSEDYSDILAWLNAPAKEAEKALEAMK